MQDPNGVIDEKSESRLYITEATLIKMFSPFGKIVSEDCLWHTRGPKRGEPRGFAFIQVVGEASIASACGHSSGQLSQSAKIAAINNKLKASEEDSSAAKKQKHGDNVS
ncbi:Splicing factor-like protein [Parasponia andersonii]|uniref:Splicing factor-like protein n=1 Tax=Parasponia andersonii TaxID=3476 RepID=A0A2P5CAV5_PARAD|nr:Splicing factor-like protein [Parasponia andersonii]